ncbi:MAG: hypothetical protein PHT07_06620 [Paludibacter sp.]|nr:hypothetical protein [Paludibacter sp.]
MPKALSTTIAHDSRLDSVELKAEKLLREGLNAGDSYNEIWIRDLNTFVELACRVGDNRKIRESLLTFFRFQGVNGNIVDGYVPKEKVRIAYNYIYSPLAPAFAAHKNTVETDQETSLIQSIRKYINSTGDRSILTEQINKKTVLQRMEESLKFLLQNRYDKKHGLLWGATTADWGDVQPEHPWGVELDSLSHLSIDIYDNAMFIIAINDYLTMDNTNEKYWTNIKKNQVLNIRKYLWDKKRQKFIPHIYLNGSPFPAAFDENMIYYHGGTAVAIEAGLLNKYEIKVAYRKMQQNVTDAGAQSIGLTLYPVYPKGYFKNSWMSLPYFYQNGGDWTWFGGRMVQQLIVNGFYQEAYEAISPMLDRVITNKGFYEWYTPEGKPNSGNFKGSAGVLWKALQMFKPLEKNNANSGINK